MCPSREIADWAGEEPKKKPPTLSTVLQGKKSVAGAKQGSSPLTCAGSTGAVSQGSLAFPSRAWTGVARSYSVKSPISKLPKSNLSLHCSEDPAGSSKSSNRQTPARCGVTGATPPSRYREKKLSILPLGQAKKKLKQDLFAP